MDNDKVYVDAKKLPDHQPLHPYIMRPYKAKDYSHLIGLEGFSQAGLQSHFQAYQGYVDRAKAHLERLRSMLNEGKTGIPQCAELRKRFAYEFNGMRLHEHYFDNLGRKNDIDSGGLLYRVLIENFGSFDLWKIDFVAAATMPGRGWAVLYHDTESGHLTNSWIMENGFNHFVGCKPLLVIDAWEDAYAVDYALHREKYVETFLKNIDWVTVANRFECV